jgi:hypothetical protein
VLSHENIRDAGGAEPFHGLDRTQVEVECLGVRDSERIPFEKLAHQALKRFTRRLLKDRSWDIHQGWKVTEVFIENGQVLPGKIYQVRGYDLANITFIKSDTGWIVFDPLTCKETAAAALKFINEKIGERPVVAVVYSHSHGDHFGGVRGVVDEKDVKSGKVKVIAPVASCITPLPRTSWPAMP